MERGRGIERKRLRPECELMDSLTAMTAPSAQASNRMMRGSITSLIPSTQAWGQRSECTAVTNYLLALPPLKTNSSAKKGEGGSGSEGQPAD